MHASFSCGPNAPASAQCIFSSHVPSPSAMHTYQMQSKVHKHPSVPANPRIPPHLITPSFLLQILRTRIPYPILLNRKKTITLRQTRTIINPTNPRLPPPLLQTQSRRTRMGNDIPSNRFLRIRIKHRARPTIHLRDNLIRDHDRDAEFVSETL